MKRTISGMIGTGSLAHNRRDFIAENVDPDRVQLNICYRNENLKEVYKELFDEAVERYNVGKRKDRQITNYYEKIRQGKQEKLFHEVIFQIGNREDMAVGTEAGNLAVNVLDEYVKDFQKRNPTLPNMDTNGNNHCDYMYGAVSVVIYYWHDQKICSCNNRYFFDCYCVTASYYHQKHNQSGVHNASYLSCYCYRHCYTTYL